MLSMLQTVRVVRDMPSKQLTEGLLGTVVFIHDLPTRAYEVEFADPEGRTTHLAVFTESDVCPGARSRCAYREDTRARTLHGD